MAPMIWRNQIYNFRNAVSHKGREPIRISAQPTQDDRAIRPSMDLVEVDFQDLGDMGQHSGQDERATQLQAWNS